MGTPSNRKDCLELARPHDWPQRQWYTWSLLPTCSYPPSTIFSLYEPQNNLETVFEMLVCRLPGVGLTEMSLFLVWTPPSLCLCILSAASGWTWSVWDLQSTCSYTPAPWLHSYLPCGRGDVHGANPEKSSICTTMLTTPSQPQAVSGTFEAHLEFRNVQYLLRNGNNSPPPLLISVYGAVFK